MPVSAPISMRSDREDTAVEDLAKAAGQVCGERLAREHAQEDGALWSNSRMVATVAHLAWQRTGKGLASPDDDEAAFLAAFEDAYRSFGR